MTKRATLGDFMVSTKTDQNPPAAPDKQREKSILRKEKQIRSMARVSLDALIMIDGQGVVDFWNPAAEGLFGYTEKEALGRYVHTLLAGPKDKRRADKKMPEFAITGKGPVVDGIRELEAICKDGSHVDVELSVAAFDMDGMWYAVGVVRDITERKKIREALEEAWRKAEQAHYQLSLELTSLSDLQRGILPAKPYISSYLSARGIYQPSGLTGGDYFDYLPLADGGLRCVVADVSGHGARAAFIMAMVRTLFHFDANQNLPLPFLVEQLNRQLINTVGKQGDFVTLVAMDISPENNCIQYINAGHCPGFFRDAGGIREIEATGPLLGFLDAHYPHHNLECKGKWELLLYTDGFYECQVQAGSILGYDPFRALCFLLLRRGDFDVEQLPGEVARAAPGMAGFDDDLTALHVTGNGNGNRH